MSHKVLVFESDAAFASELRNELGKLGCATSVVDDGNVGLQQAASDKPDLILLSIELPRMNGFSVCNKLKKDPSLKEVPLIIMSSESSDETFEQHRKLRTRAEDYVHKPIAFGELLQHIQSFVKIGSGEMGSTSEGDAIIIDDEVAVDTADPDEEGTQVRPAFLPPGALAKPVDPEVDQFADAAFGRLETRRANGASAAPMADVVPSPKSGAPPRPAGVDMVELERLKGDAEKAKARAQELERELAQAKSEISRLEDDHNRGSKSSDEAQRLQRELDELKTKLASSGKSAGVSSREFLDLREALNKKDKEILSLKEALTKKDKEIYESRDKSLALERLKSDLDDKILLFERELNDKSEKIDALTADKDNAKKVGEDLKTRLARSQSEVEAKQREIVDLKVKAQEEAAAHEAQLSKLSSDHGQALERAAQERAQALSAAEASHAARLEEHGRTSAKDKAEALAARETELRADTEQKLAALHRAHQDELGRLRGEHERLVQELTAKYDRQLGDALTRHETELSQAETKRTEDVARVSREAAEALMRREQELESLRQAEAAARNEEHAERVAQLENDRDARIAQIEARAAREVAEQKAQADAQESAANARIADLTAQLQQTTEHRDGLSRDLDTTRDRVVAIEADLAATKQTLEETRSRLAQETSRADRAVAKWDADKGSLERAKDALAVALAQIEETEART